MEKFKHAWHKTPRPARRVLVFVIGIACIVAGLFMLVLPGPGWATIFLGLAILASEFDRAERIRAAIAKRFRAVIDKARSSKR